MGRRRYLESFRFPARVCDSSDKISGEQRGMKFRWGKKKNEKVAPDVPLQRAQAGEAMSCRACFNE